MSTDELWEESDRFGRDIAYFEEHQEEFVEQYPEKWVAVFNLKVVGASSDLEELVEDLAARGVPPNKALVRHLTKHEDVLIV